MIDSSDNLSEAAVSPQQRRARGCLAAAELFILSGTGRRTGRVTGNKCTFPLRPVLCTCIISAHLLAQTAPFPPPEPSPGQAGYGLTKGRCCLMPGPRCNPGMPIRNEGSGHKAPALTRREGTAPSQSSASPAGSTQTLWPGVFGRRKSYPGRGMDGEHRGQEILQVVMTFIKSLSALG